VNVSDVAAMAASPRYALVAIAAPGDVDAAWVVELVGGMRDACAEYALALVGGDTNRADLIVVSVAVVGEVAPGRAVLRSGARAGDRIVVTGSLGAAAGGLALSRAASGRAAEALSQPWGRALIEALERPIARVGEAQVLARVGATAMMDLSDGLSTDLSRLCEASGVGARVVLGAVPSPKPCRRGAEMLEVDASALALSGGEDYELLATVPGDAVEAAREDLRSGSASTCRDRRDRGGIRRPCRGRRRPDGATRTLGMGSLRPGVAWVSWTIRLDRRDPGRSRSPARTRAAAPGSRPI
jgi:thiamine-monophosphate kinase